MKKMIAWLLILATLLLAGCQRVVAPSNPTSGGPGISADPTNTPTEPKTTDPGPTDPIETQPTEPAVTEPTDPQPTDPAPTEPTEPAPTEPFPTEPEPTEPSDPVLAIPDEFPADLVTDQAALAVFQEFYDTNIWARHASSNQFERPTGVYLRGLFYGAGMEDDIPVTEEDRAAIAAKVGHDHFNDRKAYCLSAEKMDQVLKAAFGISLREATNFANLYYLESSGNYCYFHKESDPVVKVNVMGIRTLKNGSTEVYYRNEREDKDYPKYYGVMTLKAVDGGYHMLSNSYIDVWPEPGHIPTIPEGAPADLNTDADVVKKFQKLFDNDSWFTQALNEEFDDPRTINLVDFLFPGGGDHWPTFNVTKEEMEEVISKTGPRKEWESDWYRMDAKTVEEVLQTVFGVTLSEFINSADKYLRYLESTDSYYYGRSDSSLVRNVSVAGIRQLENGNIEVYYTCKWLYPHEGVVTLKPIGDSYIVISNKGL